MSPTLKSTGAGSLWAKIFECSPWSRPLMFGSAESEHPRLTNGEIISEELPPNRMWSQSTNITDGRTDRRFSASRGKEFNVDSKAECSAYVLVNEERYARVSKRLADLYRAYLCVSIQEASEYFSSKRNKRVEIPCLDFDCRKPWKEKPDVTYTCIKKTKKLLSDRFVKHSGSDFRKAVQ